MTPLRMRLFVGAFLAVATAISINALYLQEPPRLAASAVRARQAEAVQPAPASTATAALPKEEPKPRQPDAEPAVASASPAPEARAPAPTLDAIVRASAPPAPAKLVKAIQRELSARGYAAGQANGLLGMQTRTAILAYEFDEGLPLAGEASEAVLKALIFGKAAGKGGPGPDGRFEGRKDLVAKVQRMLAQMGYSAGPIDGRLDAATREAIRKFESDRHLQADGRLTERVLLEMVIVTGRPFGADG